MANRHGSRDAQERLLALLETLVRETRPDRSNAAPIDLDSRLDRDLGLDSLARSELLLRVEQAFGIRLPESALLAETPKALLELLQAQPQTTHVSSESRGKPAPTPPLPPPAIPQKTSLMPLLR
ncbi:acyl carrier protein [Billgrantia tianxiuensis]|uniref:acyl carrier protein n=1 Tax=Billgrantia tianxiuensis TaxID=2497861 RepID=UPI001916C6B0|nr:acyl carrier protein [Halomonas tianxiuensis]